MPKYIFLYLETQEGEHNYEHKSVHKLRKFEDAEKWADEYCSDFWAGPPGEKNDKGWYEFNAGGLWTRVREVREIKLYQYNILRSFL